jgi:hypothetical protein
LTGHVAHPLAERAAWKWGQDFILPPGFCPASCGGSENAGQKAGGRMKS